MKIHEVRQREIVSKRECVEFTFDLCGCQAEYPIDEAFVWGSVGLACGELTWYWAMDGEDCRENRDLCWGCAEALGKAIDNPETLLALIGREPQKPGS